MDNIRTNMGTVFTAVAFFGQPGGEIGACIGNLCNPDDVAALAAFLKKWENYPEVTIDLSIG